VSQNATVSIIMPSHNSARFIGESIRSVQAQDFRDWELLVSDDGSTDDTCSIVRSLQRDDPRIRLLASPVNQGPAASRNAALSAAQGRYVAFLDSDDLWEPDKLTKQLAFMQERGVAFCHTYYTAVNEDGERSGEVKKGLSSVTYEDLLAHRTTIGCLTVMFDTEKCGRPLMPDIRRRQDYALWLKILKQGITAERLEEPLAFYRVRKNSVSRNKIRAAWYVWRVYREVEGLNVVRSLYYFAHYGIYHLVPARSHASS
jgi:teichuronic acid biosynthesis glycosyltransferase TuaG